jgi:hypothetical protein
MRSAGYNRTWKEDSSSCLPGTKVKEHSFTFSNSASFNMATDTIITTTEQPRAPTQSQYPRKPLELKDVLDSYQFDVTPVIGREFVDVNLKEWLRAPNSDDLIRDLAITSKHTIALHPKPSTNIPHSLSTRCSLLPRARRPRQRPPKGARPTSWRTFRQTRDIEITYPSCPELWEPPWRQRR